MSNLQLSNNAIVSLHLNAVFSCDPLRDIRNGRVLFTGTTVDSTATYSCNKGYILVGEQTRTCQYDGQWSGEEPVCECK